MPKKDKQNQKRPRSAADGYNCVRNYNQILKAVIKRPGLLNKTLVTVTNINKSAVSRLTAIAVMDGILSRTNGAFYEGPVLKEHNQALLNIAAAQ